MKTAKELIKEFWGEISSDLYDSSGRRISAYDIEYVIRYALSEGYNQAIYDASESAELLYRMPQNDEYSVEKIPCGVDKQSILKLKK